MTILGLKLSVCAHALTGVRTLTGNIGFEVKQHIANAPELVVEADKQLLSVAPATIFDCQMGKHGAQFCSRPIDSSLLGKKAISLGKQIRNVHEGFDSHLRQKMDSRLWQCSQGAAICCGASEILCGHTHAAASHHVEDQRAWPLLELCVSFCS